MTTTATHPIEALRDAAKEARRWARAEMRAIEDRIEVLSDHDEPNLQIDRKIEGLEEQMGQIEELLGVLSDVRTHTRGMA